MMENIIKGWITSTIGLIIALCSVVHYFGFYTFPSKSGIGTSLEALIALCVGIGLFVIKKSVLEESAEKIIKRKSDKV